jgi:hypothetical protein
MSALDRERRDAQKQRDGAARVRRIVVRTSNTYYYDPERVQALYEQLRPDPHQYGDDPAYAIWTYLHDSLYGSDVFEDRGDFDQWVEEDVEVGDDD